MTQRSCCRFAGFAWARRRTNGGAKRSAAHPHVLLRFQRLPVASAVTLANCGRLLSRAPHRCAPCLPRLQVTVAGTSVICKGQRQAGFRCLWYIMGFSNTWHLPLKLELLAYLLGVRLVAVFPADSNWLRRTGVVPLPSVPCRSCLNACATVAPQAGTCFLNLSCP